MVYNFFMKVAVFAEKSQDTTGGIPSSGVKKVFFDGSFKSKLQGKEVKNVDIVHIFATGKLRKRGIRLAKKYKKPIVISEMNYIPKDEQKKEVEMLNSAQAVIVPTWKFGDGLMKLGVKVPIAVVPAFLSERELRAKYAPRKMLAGEKLKIFWKGEMTLNSGILAFLEALSGLDTEQGYEAYIYGTGELFKAATKFADGHKVNARFYGEVSGAEMQRKMAECHLGVCSRINDMVQPIELIEMKHAGLPILIRDDRYEEFLAVGGYVLCKKKTIIGLTETIERVMKCPWAIEGVSQRNLNDKNGVVYAGQNETIMNVYRYINRGR